MTLRLIHDEAIPVVRIGSTVRINPDDCAKFIEGRRGRRTGE